MYQRVLDVFFSRGRLMERLAETLSHKERPNPA
jgi:hypothetical protein